MNITGVGDGGWGTAIAMLLHGYGHDVTVWGPFEEYLAEVRATRENPRFLPGFKLPDTLRWSSSPSEAVRDAEALILAIPSKFLAAVCRGFKDFLCADTLTVSLTKGLCGQTNRRMSEVARDILGVGTVAVLSGPSHAEEVARGLPTAVVAADENPEVARRVQRLFNGPVFRVYTSTDPLGVEIGGAVKNVVAIAVGVADGLGFGDNTRAALITRGLAEVTRFGKALGASPETLAGLSGVGDLIVTCTSRHSRNHAFGERLGRGERVESILASQHTVAEGVWNSRVIHKLSQLHGVEMPITALVYALCYEGMAAHTAVEELMARDMRPE